MRFPERMKLIEGFSFEEFIEHGTRIIPYPVQFFDPSLNVVAVNVPEVDVPSEFYDSAEIGYSLAKAGSGSHRGRLAALCL